MSEDTICVRCSHCEPGYYDYDVYEPAKCKASTVKDANYFVKGVVSYADCADVNIEGKCEKYTAKPPKKKHWFWQMFWPTEEEGE